MGHFLPSKFILENFVCEKVYLSTLKPKKLTIYELNHIKA